MDLVTLALAKNYSDSHTGGAFPSAFDTTHTLVQFGQSVINYSGFKAGTSWHGGLQCQDLPCGMIQCECIVTALRDKTSFPRNIAVIELFSSEVPPFYWSYNTDSYNRGTGNDDWKFIPCIDKSKFPTDATTSNTCTVKCRKVSYGSGREGWEFYVVKD